MFALLNRQQQRLPGSGEHKQPHHDDEQPRPVADGKPIKRKTRTTDTSISATLHAQSSSSAAPLLSASSYIASHPQRVARINFHRLLARLEKRVQTANHAAGEHKEALDSVREQTLLRKVSRTQHCTALHGSM